MLIPSAEESFARGLNALAAGRRTEALAQFEAAIELERRYATGPPQARYLSYYGLCLALQTSQIHEAMFLCRQAVTIEGYNPDIRCNLGRVLMSAGRRSEAYRCFTHGLRLAPSHGKIRQALKRMGRRRRLVLPFLSRGHPINVLLGRLRA